MGEILSWLKGDGGWMEDVAALGELAFVLLVDFPWLCLDGAPENS